MCFLTWTATRPIQNVNYPPLVILWFFYVDACFFKYVQKSSSFHAFFIHAQRWAYCPHNKNSSCDFCKKILNIAELARHDECPPDLPAKISTSRRLWPLNSPPTVPINWPNESTRHFVLMPHPTSGIHTSMQHMIPLHTPPIHTLWSWSSFIFHDAMKRRASVTLSPNQWPYCSFSWSPSAQKCQSAWRQ